mmetsp:Transcript_98981/g.307913  ORF Transcript_98981/g.307913 Transcript_98981/m.307913 type:complete len:280 (+) Transcript_98981:366-1205(+)
MLVTAALVARSARFVATWRSFGAQRPRLGSKAARHPRLHWRLLDQYSAVLERMPARLGQQRHGVKDRQRHDTCVRQQRPGPACRCHRDKRETCGPTGGKEGYRGHGLARRSIARPARSRDLSDDYPIANAPCGTEDEDEDTHAAEEQSGALAGRACGECRESHGANHGAPTEQQAAANAVDYQQASSDPNKLCHPDGNGHGILHLLRRHASTVQQVLGVDEHRRRCACLVQQRRKQSEHETAAGAHRHAGRAPDNGRGIGKRRPERAEKRWLDHHLPQR